LCTIHASSAVQALARLTSCVLQAGVDVPYAAVRHQIGEAVQVVAHMARTGGHRRVGELVHVHRYMPDDDRYEVKWEACGQSVTSTPIDTPLIDGLD